MKKATETNKSVTITMTLDEIRKRKPTKRERTELAALAALPDEAIDTSDIPEITATTGWIRNPFFRRPEAPDTGTIRLNAPDLAVAQALSKSKGVPYEAYVQQLLHVALERELLASRQ